MHHGDKRVNLRVNVVDTLVHAATELIDVAAELIDHLAVHFLTLRFDGLVDVYAHVASLDHVPLRVVLNRGLKLVNFLADAILDVPGVPGDDLR